MNSKLNKILNIAKEKVPYYQKIVNKDSTLESMPVINRNDISQYNQEFINSDYNSYDLKNMICLRTSGTSTGCPLNVYWKPEDYNRSSYWIWKYRKLWYDVSPRDRYVCFHTYIYSGNRAVNNKLIFREQQYLSFNALDINDEKIKMYCEKIVEFQPVWIQFLPSIAIKFVEYMKKNNIPPFPFLKYIEYNGETLSEGLRTEVDCFFGVTSANLYGSMEVNAIGYECPHKNMQIMSDNVLLEVIENSACVTSLYNTSMPIVRYDLGDMIDIEKNRCNCTENEFMIKKVRGRTFNRININGTMVSEAFAGYCIDQINGYVCNTIKQFQFVENDKKWKLVLFIDKKFNGWKENISLRSSEVFKENGVVIELNDIEFTNEPIKNLNKKWNFC